MKGVVFRSFEAFVIERFGEKVADAAMELPDLSSAGAYTAVGDYPHSDFLTLAVSVANQTNTPINVLVTDFGEALFNVLATAHAEMTASYTSAIGLLNVIESVIHRDVRKIYSNAELPQFDILARRGNEYIHMEYSSSRPFADLAEGLVKGCLAHYGEESRSSIEREDITPDGTRTRFKISILND